MKNVLRDTTRSLLDFGLSIFFNPRGKRWGKSLAIALFLLIAGFAMVTGVTEITDSGYSVFTSNINMTNKNITNIDRIYVFDEGGEYIYGDGTKLYLRAGGRIDIDGSDYLFGSGNIYIASSIQDSGGGSDMSLSNSGVLRLKGTNAVALEIGKDGTYEGGDIEVNEDAGGNNSLYFDSDEADLTIGNSVTRKANVDIYGNMTIYEEQLINDTNKLYYFDKGGEYCFGDGSQLNCVGNQEINGTVTINKDGQPLIISNLTDGTIDASKPTLQFGSDEKQGFGCDSLNCYIYSDTGLIYVRSDSSATGLKLDMGNQKVVGMRTDMPMKLESGANNQDVWVDPHGTGEIRLVANTEINGTVTVNGDLTATTLTDGTTSITGGDITGADDVNCTDLFATNIQGGSDLNLESNLDGTGFNVTADNFVGDLTGTADTATTWDSETSQADLNVNSSNYWDLLDDPTDITTLGTVGSATSITTTDLIATNLEGNLDGTDYNLTIDTVCLDSDCNGSIYSNGTHTIITG